MKVRTITRRKNPVGDNLTYLIVYRTKSGGSKKILYECIHRGVLCQNLENDLILETDDFWYVSKIIEMKNSHMYREYGIEKG